MSSHSPSPPPPEPQFLCVSIHPVVHAYVFGFHTLHGVMALFLILLSPFSTCLGFSLFTVWFHVCFPFSLPSFSFVSQQVGIDQVDIPDLSQVSGAFHLSFSHVASPWSLIHVHPIDHHPPALISFDFPLIYQTFRIGASRNLLHTRALPRNQMCCFAFSVVARGKWVPKLVYVNFYRCYLW